jgi:hypothetical protein
MPPALVRQSPEGRNTSGHRKGVPVPEGEVQANGSASTMRKVYTKEIICRSSGVRSFQGLSISHGDIPSIR